jgi:MoaA/NifB/PqqE/SkfB family radical SAM enzyme
MAAEKYNNKFFKWGVSYIGKHGQIVVRNRVARKIILKQAYKAAENGYRSNLETQKFPIGVCRDHYEINKAFIASAERILTREHPISNSYIEKLAEIMVNNIVISGGKVSTQKAFFERHGERPPALLVVSPTKSCNLYCTGCYANAGKAHEKLSWETFDRILTEARDIFGNLFVVISGGEPFTYKDQGKTLLDMVEKHSDMFFMSYTNGTLIDDATAQRLARTGNFVPAISVEGWRERTDERRGKGTFDKILAAMANLCKYGVPFGISLTATKYNCEEILSDDFIDYFFMEQGAAFGWIFHYMPIGRSFTTELMPTPEQRLKMWQRSWKLVREKHVFMPDFWNHGTLVDGCIASGRSNGGGYMYINWDGKIMPCVFVPYSPANINTVFAEGKDLNDVYEEQFFKDIREWQTGYRNKNGNGKHGNLLAPCFIRDHHDVMRQIIAKDEPDPENEPAKEALLDNEYRDSMIKYGKDYQELSAATWEEKYLQGYDYAKALAELDKK